MYVGVDINTHNILHLPDSMNMYLAFFRRHFSSTVVTRVFLKQIWYQFKDQIFTFHLIPFALQPME